jgi:sugar O-acyltransferase (sialic acid O-acetyltransferase NeuD family)
MKKLIIIGAGGFGREVLQYARSIPAAARGWEPHGFLDANPDALERFGHPLPILGDPVAYAPAPDEVFICAIGDPRRKLLLCRGLRERGARFVNLIHPTAIVGERTRFGECPWSGLSADVRIGDFVTVNSFSGAGHDVVMGDGCTLSAHVDVTGGVVLGEGVFIGTHASVLPNVRIADYAVLGAGSVVLKNVRAGRTVFGLPAVEM